jgi:predicted esterase
MRGAYLATVGLLLSGQSLARSPEPFVRGEIVERVACAANPDQTYALYLPSSYDPARRWPILYLFDPSARGERAAGRFRKGAEAYGFLLAASNNSKNGPMEESLAAAHAVWKDTHARFSIDDRRVYSAGFSGGARVATLEAQLLSGSIAGVIGCGAGFPDNRPPGRDDRFDYFGIVGNADFNHSEMKTLDATLKKLGIPNGLAIFEGLHQWPPEEVCAEALEWMRVREAARGVVKDAALVDASFQARLARASATEASGRFLDAHREYEQPGRSFTE